MTLSSALAKGHSRMIDLKGHRAAQIRVLSVQRTNNKFHARIAAHARTYHYYLPSAALSPASSGAPATNNCFTSNYSASCTHGC